jgi:uncharacterized membrane protein
LNGTSLPPRADAARAVTLGAWVAFATSLLGWIRVGYPWQLCGLAILPLLAPLSGLARGERRTYAWATLFVLPYLMFALTEALVNPRVRWMAALCVVLAFAWFCAMVAFLRLSRAPRG